MQSSLKSWGGVLAIALLLPGVVVADDELTLYGRANVSLEEQSNGQTTGTYISSNSSRLGVTATYDFNSNITVFAQYESGVDATGKGASEGDGSGGQPGAQGQLFTRARDTFAGLRGRWGAIKFGRLSEGGANAWVYDVNYFADVLGDAGTLLSIAAPYGRADSTVNYALPELGGFGLNVSYTPKDTTASNVSGSTVLNASYSVRIVTIHAHYARFDRSTVGATTISGAKDPAVAAVSVAVKFTGGTAGAEYVRDSNEGAIDGRNRDIATVGADYKLGGGTLKAQYIIAGSYSNSGSASIYSVGSGYATNNGKTGAQQFAIGYEYPLGHKASLYIVYSRMGNDAYASFTPADYGHGRSAGVAAPGDNPYGVGIGLTYNFAVGWK